MKVQTKAKLRYLRMSPRKVRLLIDLIRGMKVNAAVTQLEFSKKQAARPVLKLLKSAMANAQHNDQADPQSLVVKTAFVDGGPILYRWMPRAFGRATKIRKRTSHVTIVLEGDQKAGKAGNAKKAGKAEAEKVKEVMTKDQKDQKTEDQKIEKKDNKKQETGTKKQTKKPAAKKPVAKKKAAPKKSEKKEEKK